MDQTTRLPLLGCGGLYTNPSKMLIELDQAGRKFQGKWAVRGLTVRIESGSLVAVLGANGAGKSTLLRLLAGWLPLSEGAIQFDGSPLRPTAIHVRRRVMLLDGAADRMTPPVTTLSQQFRDYRVDRAGLEDEVAHWFDLLDVSKVYAQRAGDLSRGQIYKMLMAGLFVIRPELWLLDEPYSSGLDAFGLRTLEEQIQQHCRQGGIAIFSSQWPEHARRLADRVWVLDEGVPVWDAPPSQSVPRELLTRASDSLLSVLQGLGDAAS